MFKLLRIISEKEALLSSALTACVTAMIFIHFEYGFDIELYRGAIYKMWAGDTDF